MQSNWLWPICLLCVGCQTGPKSFTAQQIKDATSPLATTLCEGSAEGSNRNHCVILVAVEESASGCRVRVVAKQDSVVFERFVRDRLIVWQLEPQPGGYRFTDDGIRIKRGLDPFGNFDVGAPLLNGQFFARVNVNNVFGIGDYPYMVSVENPIKGIRCQQDPVIRNR